MTQRTTHPVARRQPRVDQIAEDNEQECQATEGAPSEGDPPQMPDQGGAENNNQSASVADDTDSENAVAGGSDEDEEALHTTPIIESTTSME